MFSFHTCEPISEEPQDADNPGPRRHRLPTRLARTNSAPLLISTTTTSPVYINMSSSLIPRSDSYPVRARGTSHMDFKTATTGVAAKAMRNELSNLVSGVSDPQTRKVHLIPLLAVQIADWLSGLRRRDAIILLSLHPLPHRTRQACRSVGITLSRPHPPWLAFSDWDRIKSPAADQIVPYANLPKANDVNNLNKLAVLKVNGGLGTSMGISFLSLSLCHRCPSPRHDRR